MKKIYLILLMIGFLTVFAIPLFASAAETTPKECCLLKRAITLGTVPCSANSVAGVADKYSDCGTTYCQNSASQWGMFCVINTLNSVSDWMFVVLVALSGIFIILGAFQILMAGGNSENVDKGRHYITYAAIGLVAGLLARAIPNLVIMISGM